MNKALFLTTEHLLVNIILHIILNQYGYKMHGIPKEVSLRTEITNTEHPAKAIGRPATAPNPSGTFEPAPTAHEFPELLDNLKAARTPEKISEHFDSILNHLSRDIPIADKHLESLKTGASQAKSAVTDGVWNSLKKFFSSSYRAKAASVDTKFAEILGKIGAKKAMLNERPVATIDTGAHDIKSLTERNAELEKQLSLLQNTHLELKAAGSDAGKTIAELTGNNNDLVGENTELRRQLALSQDEPLEPEAAGNDEYHQSLGRELSKSEGKLKSVQGNLKEAHGAIAGLREENAAISAENTDLAAKLETAKKTNARQAATHQATSTELTALKGDHEEISVEHSALTKENGVLKRNVEKLNAQLEAQAADHAGELESIQAETMKNLMGGLLQKLTPELYAQVMAALK